MSVQLSHGNSVSPGDAYEVMQRGQHGSGNGLLPNWHYILTQTKALKLVSTSKVLWKSKSN